MAVEYLAFCLDCDMFFSFPKPKMQQKCEGWMKMSTAQGYMFEKMCELQSQIVIGPC